MTRHFSIGNLGIGHATTIIDAALAEPPAEMSPKVTFGTDNNDDFDDISAKKIGI